MFIHINSKIERGEVILMHTFHCFVICHEGVLLLIVPSPSCSLFSYSGVLCVVYIKTGAHSRGSPIRAAVVILNTGRSTFVFGT